MAPTFALFNAHHLSAILFTLIFSIAPLILLKRSPELVSNPQVPKVLGWVLILYGIFKHLYGPYGLGEDWRIWLPLHMCQVSNFLAGYALVSGKRGKIIEVVYFWTFAGASMALLTPDLKYGWPDPNFILYVMTHWLLILGALYFPLVEGWRPQQHSIWKVFKISIYYMLIILPLNYLIGGGANYLYLRFPPVAGSLMDMMPPPPGHIPFVMLLAYLAFWLVYSPYWIRDRNTA